MPPISLHNVCLDIIRRRAVYWPPMPAAIIQGELQSQIELMRRDGYEPEAISRLLRRLAYVAVSDAGPLHMPRAVFFAELVRLEAQ
jgi:hypothetical protein